jgi:hypothetical protein
VSVSGKEEFPYSIFFSFCFLLLPFAKIAKENKAAKAE